MGLRRCLSGLLGIALAVSLPAPALAGTVALQREPGLTYPFLTYRAAAGERNVVTISGDGERVEDRAGLTAGSGCAVEPNSGGRVAICPVEVGVPTVTLILGDEDDRATVEGTDHGGDIMLRGGPGDDLLRSAAGSYNRFVGGRGDDVMSGGGYRTGFDEGSRPNGSDTMRAPTLTQQQYGWVDQGEAWVDYGARRRRVTADLDGARDDGERGERDLLGVGVTGIGGGRAGDVLTGGAGHNQLIGGPGTDLLQGRGGDDALAATTTSTRLGTPGRGVRQTDRDRLVGGRGQDLLEGSAGPNLLAPGPGPDAVYGAGGADRIQARDGFVDQIRCGDARDRVSEDEIDVLRECERFSARHRGAVPLEISSYFSDCRYGPPCDHPWHAIVRAACARPRAARCTGIVALALDGRPVGEMAFQSDNTGRVYTDIEVSEEVELLLQRRDSRMSVTVTSAGEEVAVNVARLPGNWLPMPVVP